MKTTAHSRHEAALLELATFACLVVHFHQALLWVARSWADDTYQSWGVLGLAGLALVLRGLPGRRSRPRTRYLAGVLALTGLDLLTAPLAINVLSAAFAIVALQLAACAFRSYGAPWYAQRSLLFALLCLPVVYWADVLIGHRLQCAASQIAATGLRLYGIEVVVDGTLLRTARGVIAVDAACSGVKLLFAGLLFGAFAQPRARTARLRFWPTLVISLLGANGVRVLSLALVHLRLARPPSDPLHQAIGLASLALACALAWLVGHRRGVRTRRPGVTLEPRSTCEVSA